MAYSKCPKCDSHYFELKENTPSGSNFKLQFVQCASCGTVVSSEEYYDVGYIIKTETNKKIEKLENEIRNVEYRLNEIERILKNLNNKI